MTTCTPQRALALADLIAYAWFQIGFRPRDSVVVVGMRQSRLAGAVARIDRPPRAHEGAAIEALLQPLRRTGDDGVVVLLVSDRPRTLPHARFARRLADGFDDEGFEVLDVVQVGRQHYASYLCADESCCPATGFSLEAISASAVAAGMVLRGKSYVAEEGDLVADVRAPTPGDGVRDPAPGDDDGVAGVPGASESGSTWPPLAQSVTARQRSAWLRQWLREVGRRPTRQQDGGDPPEGLTRWLALALEDATTRDALLVTIARPGPGGVATARALLAGRYEGLAESLSGDVPDRRLAERARVLIAAVARQAPPGRRAEALAALAWAAWWLGEAARARLLCELALQDRPGHRLASLVEQLLCHALPPPWLTRLNDPQVGDDTWTVSSSK